MLGRQKGGNVTSLKVSTQCVCLSVCEQKYVFVSVSSVSACLDPPMPSTSCVCVCVYYCVSVGGLVGSYIEGCGIQVPFGRKDLNNPPPLPPLLNPQHLLITSLFWCSARVSQ